MDEHPSDWRWEAIAETPTASPMISAHGNDREGSQESSQERTQAVRVRSRSRHRDRSRRGVSPMLSEIRKASDLDDIDVLRVIDWLCDEHDMWANTGDVAEIFPAAPYKVVAAKLSRLLKRGLVTGCDCGCRGDWELTAKGCALAGIERPWRTNPFER